VDLPLATVPLRRAVAAGRPAADPGCAGCAQLGTFRALRRAGLAIAGGSGCDPGGDRRIAATTGRWGAVVGAARVRALGASSVLAGAREAGARILVLADRDGVEGRRAAERLQAAGGGGLPLDGADLARAEALVRAAADAGGAAVLVALSACVRRVRRAPALCVEPARCNRCGACLSLGCAAISDPGGDAMEIDPAACNGCRLCAPLCRARAIR
jgi:TPP-dependent indolepyruvate ferredoxin oxidoreductase alpha subunit